jgi:hypothetical protein
MNMKYFSAQTMATTNTPQQRIWSMPIRMSSLPQQPQQQPIQPVVSQTPAVGKVKWGEPTWFLFHTLSVKIKDSEFSRIRLQLLNYMYAICINLPCPDCANHAKVYLDGVNFNSIQTKEHFKRLFYDFHNEVNRRKGYAFFPYDELDEKYSKAITGNIIRNFMAHFSDRNRSIKLLATDLYRQQLCKVLKEWFNENITVFDA